jgi:hypothetical protein
MGKMKLSVGGELMSSSGSSSFRFRHGERR